MKNHRNLPMSNKEPGFTLLEALVVVMLIGILAAMAYPSFKQTIEHSRVATAMGSFEKAFGYARSEAMSENAYIGICPSVDKKSCASSWNNSNGDINSLLVYRVNLNSASRSTISPEKSEFYNKNNDDQVLYSLPFKAGVHLRMVNSSGSKDVNGACEAVKKSPWITRFIYAPGGLKITSDKGTANTTIEFTAGNTAPTYRSYFQAYSISNQGRFNEKAECSSK